MLSGELRENENVGETKKKSNKMTLTTDKNNEAAKPYAVALKMTAVRKTMDRFSAGIKFLSHWTASAAMQTEKRLTT